MGKILIPLRQNQFQIVEKVGDKGQSNAGGGNLKGIYGYAIEMVKGEKKKYITFNNETGEANDPQEEKPYAWIWTFLGCYPALWPEIDNILNYPFAWNKIVGGEKVIDPRGEKVDSFFYSYVYGFPALKLMTADRQEMSLIYQIPLKLKNILKASYGNTPVGYWITKWDAQVLAGSQSYVGGNNSSDLIKEDFKLGTKDDLLDHLKRDYLKHLEEETGYGLDENKKFSVLAITEKISVELQKAMEAQQVQMALAKGEVEKADGLAKARERAAQAEEKYNQALITGEMNGFIKTIPDKFKDDKEVFMHLWEFYQMSKWKEMQAYGMPTTVIKSLKDAKGGGL